METVRHPGSFRDPSGFLFERDGVLFRHVDPRYARDYDLLMESGLYKSLIDSGLLIPHQEVPEQLTPIPGAYRVLEPERVPFVSYPYEWCFSQLKKAALSTLMIQTKALEHGLTLKDASAFNIQFVGTRPVLIDTLSFEKYNEGSPWVAYNQFCQHFLAPLELMSTRDVRFSRLLSAFLDGIPLDLASRLLPYRSWGRLTTLIHVHLHARSVRHYSHTTKYDKETSPKASQRASRNRVSRTGLDGLLQSLRSAVRKLRWSPEETQWADYEDSHGYSAESRTTKERIVGELLARRNPRTVWDLGANTGTFSRLASRTADYVLAVDVDPGAVEKHFCQLESCPDSNTLPLCMDIANPSAGLGWQGKERMSLHQRGPADMILALALVHHLAISGNIPFPLIAEGLASMGKDVLVEYVPKDDPQVRRLLVSREDIFDTYTEEAFRESFSAHFHLIERRPIGESGRVIYLMTGRRASEVNSPPSMHGSDSGEAVGG